MFKNSVEGMGAVNYKIVIHTDKRPVRAYERSFNAPQVIEIVVVIVTNNYSHSHIIIQR